MALRSNRSVHWRWCNHSMMEMRSLGSCQGLVWAAILAGAQAAWRELFATQCQDRPTKEGTLLLISMESWWLRLEGKPHFKRWGMSRTGLSRAAARWARLWKRGETTKGQGRGPVRASNKNRPNIFFLCPRTCSYSFLLSLSNLCYL